MTHTALRIVDDPLSVNANAWDELLATQTAPTPFMRHAYLTALHVSGSAGPATGWTPRFLLLEHAGRWMAAAPAYLKTHSWGEYVFDWSWADAYHRHGLHYYPKLVVAVPFTPVAGTRLMAVDASARRRLATALQELTVSSGTSGVHVLFHDETDAMALRTCGWLRREGTQFHWQVDPSRRPSCFEDLLASLQRDKRKKIAQERRRVAEAGIRFTVHRGSEITPALWNHFYQCYLATYAAHGASPHLRREFFDLTAGTMADLWLMFVAHRDARPLAASLVALDPARRTVFGRYWGSLETVPFLHFEACYYQPLQWCIDNGYDRFEGGAQGEHKIARGLLPSATQSAHLLAHRGFHEAVGHHLQDETAAVAHHRVALEAHTPFRSGGAG